MKKKIQLYFINKWEALIRSVFPDKFTIKHIEVVKVKKGKIREWRAFVDGKRISKEALKTIQKKWILIK